MGEYLRLKINKSTHSGHNQRSSIAMKTIEKEWIIVRRLYLIKLGM
jgi:hypothetical protein